MTFDLLHDLPNFAPEQISADAIFSNATQAALFAQLGDIMGELEPEAPVALWLKHSLGDSWNDAYSKLETVLSRHPSHPHWIDKTRFEDLGPACQANVIEILGVFLLEESFFDVVYNLVGFESHEVIESVHFGSFSVFWISGSFDDLQDLWDTRDRDEEFDVARGDPLKICACVARTELEACLQRMEIRRGLSLVQRFGVLGSGEFDLS